MIFSNGVPGADEMPGSIEGRLLAYETQIRSRLIADDHPQLRRTLLRLILKGMINSTSSAIDYTDKNLLIRIRIGKTSFKRINIIGQFPWVSKHFSKKSSRLPSIFFTDRRKLVHLSIALFYGLCCLHANERTYDMTK